MYKMKRDTITGLYTVTNAQGFCALFVRGADASLCLNAMQSMAPARDLCNALRDYDDTESADAGIDNLAQTLRTKLVGF